MKSKDISFIYLNVLLIIVIALMAMSTWATDSSEPSIREVLIIGTKQEQANLPGSGIRIGPDDLKKQDYSDLNQVVSAVPGIYVREEDGFGLRPNIGIRGATSDRSQKITLMEDGVLITPAPYSAPAAYYITNASRLYSVEVLKGPSAIRSGPHTVGGAINLITRPVPSENLTEVEVTAGTDEYHEIGMSVGRVDENLGFLLEGLSYGSDGFKELDGGGNTGFIRNDINLKIRWEPKTDSSQVLTLKLGFADEDADETYLGLTDLDFRRSPERRYPASQLDRFQSQHKQFHLNHSIEAGSGYIYDTKIYFNEFDRSWNKFDGFMDGPRPQNVLRNPGSYLSAYETLLGVRDSKVGDFTDLTIDVTDNTRAYSSQGIELDLSKVTNFGGLDHKIKMGFRYHEDDVRRHHQQRSYLMRTGKLISDGISRPFKTNNYAQTEAVAVFFSDEITFSDWTINLGMRYEDIDGSVDNKLTGVLSENSQSMTAPGLGVYKQVTESTGVFAGIYKGFSPSGPGRSGVEPEKSMNVEYGIRHESKNLSGELIWFQSDYDNLLGRCRASDSDCDVGQEFSGGNVEVRGFEFLVQGQFSLNESYILTSQINYTYSDSEFKSTFFSQFSQWGLVREGDELPYIPVHVGRIHVGIEAEKWSFHMSIKHQHEMREEPGGGDVSEGIQTDSLTKMDLSATWVYSAALDLKLMVRNVTDKAAIVSHRPFGARPNQPRSIMVQVKYRF